MGRDPRLPDDGPEHCNDRRRFLVWAVMLGATSPERMTERVLEDLNRDENLAETPPKAAARA